MNWYIRVNDTNVGPMTEEELRGRIARGEVDASTYVWQQGTPDWLPLSQTPLVAGGLPTAPSPGFNPVTAYIHVLSNYANFKGRARRSEYWWYVLANMAVAFCVGLVAGLVRQPLIGTFYSLATLVPSIAVGVRRVHDVDKSGWFLLIPIYNFVLLVTEGTRGPNRFGPNSK